MWGKKMFSSVSSAPSSSSSSSNARKVSSADETVPPLQVPANTQNNTTAQPASPHQQQFQVSSKDNVPVHPYPTIGEPKQEAPASGDIFVTISNHINSQVQEVRELRLKNGKVAVNNIAETIVPQSVSFVALTEPQAKVITQAREINKCNRFRKKEDGESKLRNILQAHVGERLIVQKATNPKEASSSTEGILQLVASDHLVLRSDSKKDENSNEEDNSELSNEVQLLTLSAANVYVLPKSLPTLASSILDWTIDSKSESLVADFSYACTGIKWGIEYNVKVNHNFTQVHLTGWYTLENSTSANFENAKIAVVEKTRIVEAPSRNPKETGTKRYHLPRKVTLSSNSTIQENAVNVTVPAKRFHVVKPRNSKFTGVVDLEDNISTEYFSVDQVVTFLNSEENQLGFTLPSGNCGSFLVQDEDSSLVSLDPFTFKLEEEVAVLPIATLSDAKVSRKKTEFHADSKRRVIRESFDVIINNNTKGDLLDLVIEENLHRWSEWEVTGTATISAFEQTTKNAFVDLTCEKHERKANRIVFSIPVVPFASTVTISFTVVYSNY